MHGRHIFHAEMEEIDNIYHFESVCHTQMEALQHLKEMKNTVLNVILCSALKLSFFLSFFLWDLSLYCSLKNNKERFGAWQHPPIISGLYKETLLLLKVWHRK